MKGGKVGEVPQRMDKALLEPQEKEIKALEGSRQDGAGCLKLALTPRLAQPEAGIKNLMSFQGQQMICCSCGLHLFICVESFFMSMNFCFVKFIRPMDSSRGYCSCFVVGP